MRNKQTLFVLMTEYAQYKLTLKDRTVSFCFTLCICGKTALQHFPKQLKGVLLKTLKITNINWLHAFVQASVKKPEIQN